MLRNKLDVFLVAVRRIGEQQRFEPEQVDHEIVDFGDCDRAVVGGIHGESVLGDGGRDGGLVRVEERGQCGRDLGVDVVQRFDALGPY